MVRGLDVSNIYIYIYIYIYIWNLPKINGAERAVLAMGERWTSGQCYHITGYLGNSLRFLQTFFHMLLLILPLFQIIQQKLLGKSEQKIHLEFLVRLKLCHNPWKCISEYLKIKPCHAHVILNGSRGSKKGVWRWKITPDAGGLQQGGVMSMSSD